MRTIFLTILFFSGLVAFSQNVSSDKKMKNEPVAAVANKEPVVKNETVHKPISNEKGSAGTTETIDTNTVGTISDKKNAIDETIPE